MIYDQAAQSALQVQDACNLSGVAFEYARVMQCLCDVSNTLPIAGTGWKNTHPIVTLFLLKMAELNGCGSTLHDSYSDAEAVCKYIAQSSKLTHADLVTRYITGNLDKDKVLSIYIA